MCAPGKVQSPAPPGGRFAKPATACAKKLLALVFFLLPVVAGAQPINVGDAITARDIKDQHDKPYVIDEQVRLIMFGRDMKANKVVKTALAASAQAYLPDRGAVYVLDVSAMPAFVAKHFAIPKMRKYPYRILLDGDSSLSRDFPSQPEKITLLYLDRLKVQSIEYADEPEVIRSALDSLQP